MFRIGEFSKIAQAPGSLLRFNGPGREVLIHPPRGERLDEMVTEIQFPVERDQRGSAG